MDPGLDTGWAVFSDGLLSSCGLGPPPVANYDSVTIEKPQVYAASKSKGNPNDLITLAIMVGRYVERLERGSCKVHLVLPTTWKGQVDKDIMCKRILLGLSDLEKTVALKCLTPISESKRHNVVDAIGIGVWCFRAGPWYRGR